jgi:hypothetical protein
MYDHKFIIWKTHENSHIFMKKHVITMSFRYVCWHLFFIWSCLTYVILHIIWKKYVLKHMFFKTYETHIFYTWKTYDVPNIQQTCGAFLRVYITTIVLHISTVLIYLFLHHLKRQMQYLLHIQQLLHVYFLTSCLFKKE